MSKWIHNARFLLVAAIVGLVGFSARAEGDKIVKIVHAETKKVLGVEGNSTEENARIVLAADDGNESQLWKLVKDGEHFKLVNRRSEKVLDLSESSDEDGAPIIQWDDRDEDTDNQRWSWDSEGKTKRVKSKSSGKVLDVDADGKVIQKSSDDKAKSQEWVIVVEEEKFVKIVHAETKKVLGVKDNSTEAEARVVLEKDDGNESQQWKLVKDGDHYKLVNRRSDKVLDVFEASGEDGAEIIQWDSKDEDFDNQRWSWEGEGKTKRIKSKSSGKVLDIGEEGKVIQKSSDEKAKTQVWEIVEIKAAK